MQSFSETLSSLFGMSSELWQILGVTMVMSFFSTSISALLGLPLGMLLGTKEFRGKNLIMRFVNTLMCLPPVVAGLLVFFLLSRSGPLGLLRLLYTVPAMVIAQVLLITPIITGLTASAVQINAAQIRETAIGMGMSSSRSLLYLLHENKGQLLSVVFTGFGRSIAEVGAVSIVGGNVQYKTRVMTTAIMLETNRGNFGLAVAIGVVLLLISFIINAVAVSLLKGKKDKTEKRRSHGIYRRNI